MARECSALLSYELSNHERVNILKCIYTQCITLNHTKYIPIVEVPILPIYHDRVVVVTDLIGVPSMHGRVHPN